MSRVKNSRSHRNRGRGCRCCMTSMFLAFTLFVGFCAGTVLSLDRLMLSRWGFGMTDSIRVFRGLRWVDTYRLPSAHTKEDEYRFFRALEEGLFLNSNADLSAERITEYLGTAAAEYNVGGQLRPAAVISPKNSAGNIHIEGGESLFQNIFKRENIDFERLDGFCPYLHDEGEYMMRMSGNEFASFGNALLQPILNSGQLPGIVPDDIDMTIRAITFDLNDDGVITADVQFSINTDSMVRGMLDYLGMGWLGGIGSAILPEEILINTTIGISENIAVVMSAGTMNERQTESFHRVIDGIFIMAGDPNTAQGLIDDLAVRFIAPVTALVGNFVEPESYCEGRINFDPVEMILFLSGINEGDEEDVTSRSLLRGIRDYAVVNSGRWTKRTPLERNEKDALGQINDKFFRFDTEEARVTGIGAILDGAVNFGYNTLSTFDENRFDNDPRRLDSPKYLRPFIRDKELSHYMMSKLSMTVYGGGGMGEMLDISVRKVSIDGDYVYTICLIIEYSTDSVFSQGDFGGAVFLDFADRIILHSTTFVGVRGDDGLLQQPFYLTAITINEIDVDEDGNIKTDRDGRYNFEALIERFGGSFNFEYRAQNIGRMIFDHFSEDSHSPRNIRNNIDFEFAVMEIAGEMHGGMLLEDFVSWKGR